MEHSEIKVSLLPPRLKDGGVEESEMCFCEYYFESDPRDMPRGSVCVDGESVTCDSEAIRVFHHWNQFAFLHQLKTFQAIVSLVARIFRF
jgi:hypothetical protein